MTEKVRQGLGLLAIGIACLVVSLAVSAGLDDGKFTAGYVVMALSRVLGLFLVLVGLVIVALDLLRSRS